MNKHARLMVFLSCIIVSCGLLAATAVLLRAQSEYYALWTNMSIPYDEIIVGSHHTFVVHSENGFYADTGGQRSIFYTLTQTTTVGTLGFEYKANAPTGWTVGWYSTQCSGTQTLNGTSDIWVTVVHTGCCSIPPGLQENRWWTAGGNTYVIRKVFFLADTAQYTYTVTPSPPALPPSDCGLENYEFDAGSEHWGYGDFVDWNEEEGWVRLSGCVDELNSFISQTVALEATGPSEHYELIIAARSPIQFSPGDEPLLRWKLDSQIPGDSPNWYEAQMHVFFVDYWQLQSFILRESNMAALSDTLTIWASNGDVEIDRLCISLHQEPGASTPVCPLEPTYTPLATYTPLPTPTPATTATATAWAATATAWATQAPYPTVPAPDCPDYSSDAPDWNFIWLMGQLLIFLAAFFEAIFRLLGSLLQPILDLFSFLIWLIGATFSLVASLIDLIVAVVSFLFSFILLFFNILEIIGAFIVALWNLLTMSPTDPGTPPSYFGWGVEVWDFLIEGTPLEYLEIIAMAVASLLIIRWTVKQFSSWGA